MITNSDRIVKGYIIETPDGDTIGASFRETTLACITNFMFNLNQSNMEDHQDTDDLPVEITWDDMLEDGYKVIDTELKCYQD